MRVTLVSPFDPRPAAADGAKAHLGGVERALSEIACRLARRGHRVTLLSSTDGPWGDTVEEGLRMRRVRRRLTVLRTPVAALAHHVGPDTDVVQVPATYPFTTAPVLRRAHSLGIPSVLDFHFEPVPAGRIGRLAARAYLRTAPRAYRLAHATLVRSRAYAESARSLDHVPQRRWRIVPNGIDPQRFRPDGPASGDGGLLFVGRLVPYKGIEVLLQAVSRLRPRPPLRIVGDGPLRKLLEHKAQSLYIDVEFLGRVPEAQLPALYRGAEATVLPSVNRQEAFGIALVESMACGTPVVASDLPGVGDVARLGGLVARAGDPDALAAQLRRVLDPGFAIARGPALARRAHEAYSWDAVTDRIEAVYREVVGPATDGDGLAAPQPSPEAAA
jgi:glycosyltransferase involved in cell wall biosynthesis